MVTGVISNIQRYSVHDGPGIRTTVFLKGCPLNCAWCHNPETIDRRPQLLVVESRCIRCGACLEACPRTDPVGLPWRDDPTGARRKLAGTDHHECLVCWNCVEACPVGGRTVVGRKMEVGEVMAEIRRDRLFFDDSGGGVTISGGEPLSQPDFLLAVLRACRAEGLHTAVDTCGYAPQATLERVAPLADLFLYDLKTIDDAVHRRFCGVSNQRILANLAWLAGNHRHLWLRIPLIPGVNNMPSELAAIARLAASLDTVQRVNLLPYHQVGAQKRQRTGGAALARTFTAPTEEQIEEARDHFRRAGVDTQVGG